MPGLSKFMIALAIIAVFGLSAAIAAPLTLVENGKPNASIYLPSNPSQEETAAAQELTDYIEKISGARLETVFAKPSGNVIAVGYVPEANAIRSELEKRGGSPDAFVIRQKDETLFVTGAAPSGTLNGAYTLLEKLGCRWYIPGELGETYPTSKTISIDISNNPIDFTPSFFTRAGIGRTKEFSDAFNDQITLWAKRNHMGGKRWWGSGHSYMYLVSPEQYFDSHPEYFALINGKRDRDGQICTSNPEVLKTAVDTLRKMFSENPDIAKQLICVSPNDNHRWCECEDCRKLDYPGGDKHDRVLLFANQVASALKDDYPDAVFIYYVYSDYVQPPVKIKAEPNVAGWFTLWGTTGYNMAHPFSSSANDKAQKLLEPNAALYKSPMLLYAYYGHYNIFTPYPMDEHIDKDFPWFYERNIKGFYSETHQHWGTQGLNFYLMAQKSWDMSADGNELMSAFFRDMFGPAASEMRSCYELFSTAFKTGYVGGVLADNYSRYTPDTLKNARNHMELAKAATGLTEIEKRRIEFFDKGLYVTELYCGAHHDIAKYSKERNRTFLASAKEKLERLLEVSGSKEYEGVVALKTIGVDRQIEREIADLGAGTQFSGKGDFDYRSNLAYGGRALYDTKTLTGFRGAVWGLNLPGGASGKIEWEEFAATDGVFDVCSLKVDQSPSTEMLWEISTDGGTNWQALAIALSGRTGSAGLTEIVAGKESFLLRVTGKNTKTTEDISLCSIELAGKVK